MDALVTAADVARAAEHVAGHVRRTPVVCLEPDATGVDVPVWLKLESHQVTGSFKARNAFSLLLGAQVPEAGVVAVSGGNFGLAMAHAASHLGVPITVFVPEEAARVKIDGISVLGAEVEVVSGSIAELYAASERQVAATGALFAHPYHQLEVVAGAGTCGLELDEQCPEVDTVLVAVGGGGLIGGISAWFGDRVQIVAVETEGTPTLHRAMAAGHRVEIEPTGIGVSALGAPIVGEIAWDAAQRWVDDTVLVSDDDAVAAQRRLWDAGRIVAEAGGAVAFAALTSGAYTPRPDERVAVVVCGANTDPAEVLAPSAP